MRKVIKGSVHMGKLRRVGGKKEINKEKIVK
jgi:hypothetical protein